MRLIYPLKIVQTLVAFICVYALLRGRDLCSERSQKQTEAEMRMALLTSQGHHSCNITSYQLLDYYRIGLIFEPTDDEELRKNEAVAIQSRRKVVDSTELPDKEEMRVISTEMTKKEEMTVETNETLSVPIKKESREEKKTALPTSQGQLTDGNETRFDRNKRELVKILPTDEDFYRQKSGWRPGRSLEAKKEELPTTTSPDENLGETVKLIEELTTKEAVGSTVTHVQEESRKEVTVEIQTEKAVESTELPVKEETSPVTHAVSVKEETVETTELPVGEESRNEVIETAATKKAETVKTPETLPVPIKEESSKEETAKDPTTERKLKKIDEKKRSLWRKLLDARGSYWHKTCMSVSFGLTVDWNLLPLSPLWLAVIFFLLDVFVLQLELVYSCYTREEQSRKGVWLLGSLHLIFLAGAVASLLYFRLNWQHIWSKEHLVETPTYPTGWFDTELVALLLVVCHILEMIFFRVCRGNLVLSQRMDYCVAQKESEMRTYFNAYEEPLDGSYEL